MDDRTPRLLRSFFQNRPRWAWISAGCGALALVANAILITKLLQRDMRELALLALVASVLCGCAIAALLANAVRHRVWSTLSHDIRQPLGALGLYVAALKSRVRGREEERILSGIEGCSAALTRLLSSVLSLTRVEGGGLTAAPTSFPLSPVLRDIVNAVAPHAALKGVVVKHAPTTLCIRADPDILEMVLQSAVGNAVQLPSGARMVVGARRIGLNRVAVQISDNDPGAPPSKQAAAPSSEGMRLGLAIARRISTLSGLPVKIRSNAGRGVTFLLFVPRAESNG